MSAKESGLSRRDFLRAAGAAGVGSVLTAAGALGQTAGKETGTKPAVPTVPVRPFGKTGVNVSILSMGIMLNPIGKQLLLKQALQWGVTHWDTAASYARGQSEIGIGNYFEKHGEDRKKIFLVTKSTRRDPAGLSRQLNQSLERMKTDYVDLFFLHAVRNIKQLTGEVKAWAEKAKAEKKIRFFGFSTHSNMDSCLSGAAVLGWVDGIMMTYNFRLMHGSKMSAAVDACTKAGIGLTAMKAQGGGPVRMDSEAELKLAGRFLEKGFTDKQAKLKAIWENPQIANVCSLLPNMTILMSNVAAALDKTKLSAGDKELLEQYARQTCSGYCAGCSEICERAVAEPVPVGDVMRYLMYYEDYGDRDRARELFAELPAATRRRIGRLDYSLASRRCPQHLPIGELMRRAAGLLA